MTTSRPTSLWMPIAMFSVATMFYLYEFLLRVSPSIMEQELIQSFNLDARSFGLFSACYYWPYAALQLPVGALTDKYGPRRLLTFAILLCTMSTLALAYTQSLFIGCVSRFFIGAGSAFAFISCLKIVNMWFESRFFPLLTGLTVTIGTLGGAVAGTILSLALDYMTWRPLLFYIGIVGILLAVLAWWLIRDHNPDQPEVSLSLENTPGFWRCVREVIKLPQSWIVGFYALFITAPTDAFGGTWGVKFLIDAHGLSRDMASFAAVTMTFTGMALGSPLIGWISTTINNRKLPMTVSALIAALALTLIIYLPHLNEWMASILFFVFGASGTFVLAFVMARRFAKPIYVATAVGFVNMVSMFGSAFITWFIGWLLDEMRHGGLTANGEPFYSVHDYQLSLLVLPVFYVISAVLMVPFIRDGRE